MSLGTMEQELQRLLMTTITASRVVCLRHLAQHGTTPWSRMPKNIRGRAMSNRVWLPMRDAGWITAQCHAPRGGQDPFDHYFTITEAGRTVLALSEPL